MVSAHILVRSTVYATFVILKGTVRSTGAFLPNSPA